MTAPKRKRVKPRIYGELPLEVLPRPIETGIENGRAPAVVRRLMSKGEDNLTSEEITSLELLVHVDRTLRRESLSDSRSARPPRAANVDGEPRRQAGRTAANLRI